MKAIPAATTPVMKAKPRLIIDNADCTVNPS